MKMCIISGSHRPQSGSNKTADYIAKRLPNLIERTEVDVIKLSDEALPLWDESFYSQESDLSAQWQPLSDRLRMADAYVVISPEWAGMVPPGLKNLLLFSTRGEMSHKPALIVTVSSGQGGSYPVSELRSSGYKNSHICYIPEHIIVRHADQMFNQASLPANSLDQYIRDRLDYGLTLLNAYSDGLSLVRERGIINHEQYAYGM